jgi:hypothetical protein
MQINTLDAEEVFALLDSYDQVITLDHLVEIQKQNTFDKAEGPEEKTMTVSKFTN